MASALVHVMCAFCVFLVAPEVSFTIQIHQFIHQVLQFFLDYTYRWFSSEKVFLKMLR